jgi:hypothetical protein
MVLGCDRRPCWPRTVAFWLDRPGWLDRPFWLGGLSIGFDVGPPGPIGRGLLVDHAELLPPSFGAPSQASWAGPSEQARTDDQRRLYLRLACPAHSRPLTG